MVVVGLTLTGVPLVIAVIPGVITPEPPLNTAVKLALDPDSIVAGLAAKLVIDGGAVFVEPPPEPQPTRLQMATPAITATTTEGKLRFTIASQRATTLEVMKPVTLR